jgi:hypothetical protein
MLLRFGPISLKTWGKNNIQKTRLIAAHQKVGIIINIILNWLYT